MYSRKCYNYFIAIFFIVLLFVGSTSAQREYVVDPNNNCDDFSELKEFLKKNYLISKETNSVHENANAW